MAATQLHLGHGFESATTRRENPHKLTPGQAKESAESFYVDADGKAITRQVTLRRGQVAETTFQLDHPLRKKRLDQGELGALADAAFLRAPYWPSSSSGPTAVRVADLFSGCGIMSLGVWEAARALGRRLEPVLAIDVNPTAMSVYKRNFPSAAALSGPVEHFLDGALGKTASRAESRFVEGLGPIDLLVGGPPCQGHSNLNNHTRRDDPKNRLYARMARFAELIRPRSIIIENVSAVLHDRGRVVSQTIAFLLRFGYRVDHGIAEVSALGAAQKRRRHILLASLDLSPNVERTLSLFAREPRTVDWAIGDLTGQRDHTPFSLPSTPSRANQKRIDWLFKNGEYDLPDRLRPDCHRLKEHSYRSVYGRMYWDRPSQTITSGFTSMGQGRYVHPSEPRTITPHEAARLQFIPDFFRFGEETSRTALSEMIGNAVPTKLTYVLALDLLR